VHHTSTRWTISLDNESHNAKTIIIHYKQSSQQIITHNMVTLNLYL
jgi:hypothetical protein